MKNSIAQAVLSFLLLNLGFMAQGADGAGTIFDAVRAGSLEQVCAYLDAGVAIDQRNAVGSAPLVIAVLNRHNGILRELLMRGADVNVANLVGGTPLLMAAAMGNIPAVHDLLTFHADPHRATVRGVTPLMVAAGNGHCAIVSELLARGADINAADNAGMTALMYAARSNRTEIITELMRHPGIDLHRTNNMGQTAGDLLFHVIVHQIAHRPAVAPARTTPASRRVCTHTSVNRF